MKSADMCVGGEAYPKKAPLKRKPPPIRIGARKKIVRTKECKLKSVPPPRMLKKAHIRRMMLLGCPHGFFFRFSRCLAHTLTLTPLRAPIPLPTCRKSVIYLYHCSAHQHYFL